MLKFEKSTLHFNSEACMAALLPYFIDALQAADEKFIQLLQEELFNAAGTARDQSSHIRKWRESVASAFKEENIEVAKRYIRSRIGIGQASDEIQRKAIILQKGGGPDYAGPYGRSVWDSDYAGRRTSAVQTSVPRKLSAAWKLAGRDYMKEATENAEVRAGTFFQDCLDKVWNSIPAGFYAQFLTL